jgi:hypothetical protein
MNKEKIKKYGGYKSKLKLYIKKEMRIRCFVKNKYYYATAREDGIILYDNKIYNSPSHAARAITNHESNGWRIWRYERTVGEWVALRELRC